MGRGGGNETPPPRRQAGTYEATHRIDKVHIRFIHENHMIRRPQLTPVRRQHAGLATRMLCGVRRSMPLRSTRSARPLGRDRAWAMPPAPLAAIETYILSDFMTTFYLIRQLTIGLTSHVEKALSH